MLADCSGQEGVIQPSQEQAPGGQNTGATDCLSTSFLGLSTWVSPRLNPGGPSGDPAAHWKEPLPSLAPLHSLNWSRLQPGRPQEHRGDSSWFSGNVDFSKMMKRGCNQAPDPLRLTTPHGSRFSLIPRHLHKLFPRVRIWGMVVLAHSQDQVALVA